MRLDNKVHHGCRNVLKERNPVRLDAIGDIQPHRVLGVFAGRKRQPCLHKVLWIHLVPSLHQDRFHCSCCFPLSALISLERIPRLQQQRHAINGGRGILHHALESFDEKIGFAGFPRAYDQRWNPLDRNLLLSEFSAGIPFGACHTMRH